MAFLNVNTPLKNLKTGDYFYPLTNLDQIITGNNRLSAYFSENNNKLDLINIKSIITDNLTANNIAVENLIADNFTVGKIHSNAAATDTDITRIPSNNEIALETGDGGGNISAWIWREQYSSSNWGIFHNNSTNILQVVGNNIAQFAVDLANGYSFFNGEINITKNGNTTTIGSLNSGFCHIYNTANIPFIFNNRVCTTGGGLGSESYRWGNSYFNGEISNYAPNGLRFVGGNGTIKAILLRNDGTDFWILGCNSASQGDNWANFPFHVHLETGYCYGSRIYSAVWNDYAEFRKGKITKPGYVVIEHKSGIMQLCNERLAAGAKIVSDTYGFAIGETKENKTPIAVSGRVLVYPFKDKNEYELGAAVCAAPGGTVDIMTREEIREYPERIVGIVSEIPDYEIWHAGGGSIEQGPTEEIKVDGRIWVYVR